MNIKARITARKIVLTYFYERYFLDIAAENTHMIEEMQKIEKIVALDDMHQPEVEVDVDLQAVLASWYYNDTDDELLYIRKNFFYKSSDEEIDGSYISAIAPLFSDYKQQAEDAVNKHVKTFAYDDMDVMDKVIFLLWYIEYTTLQTPKEVMLNEMIELAKRYGDESSPKLIHGIGHHVLHDVDAAKT